MAVTNLLDLRTAPLRATIDDRVGAALRRLLKRVVIKLIGKGPIEALGHGQVLRGVLEDILLLQKHVIDGLSVKLAGDKQGLLSGPDFFGVALLVVLRGVELPGLLEVDLLGLLLCLLPPAVIFLQVTFQRFHPLLKLIFIQLFISIITQNFIKCHGVLVF